ncbi:nickel pincer cofactor biosynthesis protein LarC [bacterium]|nr:nickel pincer cofactor biosynthesis protein LarC [bacterium]
MRALYFDAFAGVSGDMTIGALLALGLDLEHVRAELAALPLQGYALRATPRLVHAIAAVKFEVEIEPRQAREHDHSHDHRAYGEIRRMIEDSRLAPRVRETALAIFARLAEAEGRVHGVAAESVTFHEVGAVDSIVDIVGTAIGLHALGVEAVYASSLPLGTGLTRSQHGVIPVPGPATVELLRGLPVRVGDGAAELVTPTGAAIVAALVDPAQPLPPLRIEAVGYGAGTRTLTDRPNVLRLLLARVEAPLAGEELVEVAATIDDANPELYAHALEAVFTAGARDAWLVPAFMKKQRPGVVLYALADAGARDAVAGAILRETTAIGLRFHTVRRAVLPRQIIDVETPYGPVRVKIATAPDGTRNIAPEYEDCRRLAREHGVALKLVYQAAIAAAL